ncbi:hypothetical protein ILUMI_03061 [Ignelater luminosus]|uniref:Uncharacterized protein n=1 Tax=Ignelater luminosus TaxID=2038154 RepID=A0A8K0DBH7_IGNLU|nr:hypothetical protein ILUMI_03061 [Ignelater luminosus]
MIPPALFGLVVLKLNMVFSIGGLIPSCIVAAMIGRTVPKIGAIVHDYLPRTGRVVAAKIITIVREKASTINENPQQIIGEATGGIPESVQGGFVISSSNFEECQTNSEEDKSAPQASSSLSELVIDGPYSKTSSDEDFLLFDSKPGDPNRTPFSTEKNLGILSSSDHWFCDGIFKTALPLFTQLMTIHAIKFDAVIPLPNKTNMKAPWLVFQRRTIISKVGMRNYPPLLAVTTQAFGVLLRS